GLRVLKPVNRSLATIVVKAAKVIRPASRASCRKPPRCSELQTPDRHAGERPVCSSLLRWMVRQMTPYRCSGGADRSECAAQLVAAAAEGLAPEEGVPTVVHPDLSAK